MFHTLFFLSCFDLMNRRTSIILNFLSAAMVVTMAFVATVGAMASSGKKSKIDTDKNKADYIFLESQRLKQQNKHDAYYELVKRAYELNPDDKYLGMEVGVNRMMLSDGDSTELEQGLSMLADYAYANPQDLYNSAKYASLADNLGHRKEALAMWDTLYRLNAERPEVGLKYADMLTATIDSANLDKALEIYNIIERSEGVMPLITGRKMQIHSIRRDTTAILREAKALLEASPHSSEYNSMVGMTMMQLGRKDSALVYFDRAVELDPSSGAAYYHRVNYYKSVGDSVGYDREVFQAMRQADLDLEPKLEILRQYVGELYRDTAQTKRITDLFGSLIDLYPHEAIVRKMYAEYLMLTDKPTEASEQMGYAVDSDPSNETSWLQYASLQLQIGNWQKGVEASQRGLHYFPGNTRLIAMQAIGYNQLAQYQDAIALLDSAIAEADSADVELMSELYTTMGDSYYAWEKNDSAFAAYTKALQLNPDNLGALNNCAYYLACEDRELDKAEAMIKRVVAEKPEDGTSLDTYAWVLFKKQDYVKAKELIDGALENEAEPSAELLEHAGDIYFMNKEPDEALNFWRKALVLDPENALLKRKVKNKTFYYK